MCFVTKGVSFSHVSRAPKACGIASITNQEWFFGARTLRQSRQFKLGCRDIIAMLFHLGSVLALLVEDTHGAGPVSLVVSAIDLLGGQAQAHEHWLRRLKHDAGSKVGS